MKKVICKIKGHLFEEKISKEDVEEALGKEYAEKYPLKSIFSHCQRCGVKNPNKEIQNEK